MTPGPIHCGMRSNAETFAEWAPDLPWAEGRPDAMDADPVVVCSPTDAMAAEGRPVVLLEHGAGQSYSSDSSAYSGGEGRGMVALFLTPNETVAALNRERYPDARHVVVGAPHIDPDWRYGHKRHSDPPVVVVTAHHDAIGAQVPEARTCIGEYRDALATLAARTDRGYALVGHGHPRAWASMSRMWAEMGVPMIRRARDVLATADCLVADSTSLMYEAAALDVPIVALNGSKWRRDVTHGLRFWGQADVGVQVDRPGDLRAAIRLALADPPDFAARRREIAHEVFPVVGREARALAAAAILSL